MRRTLYLHRDAVRNRYLLSEKKRAELLLILEGLRDEPELDISEPIEGFPNRFRIRLDGYQVIYLVSEEAIRITAIHLNQTS